MDYNCRFSYNPDLAWRCWQDRCLILPIDGAGEAVSLSDTAADIWNHLPKNPTISASANRISKVYDVQLTVAENDIAELFKEWLKLGLIQGGSGE